MMLLWYFWIKFWWISFFFTHWSCDSSQPSQRTRYSRGFCCGLWLRSLSTVHCWDRREWPDQVSVVVVWETAQGHLKCTVAINWSGSSDGWMWSRPCWNKCCAVELSRYSRQQTYFRMRSIYSIYTNSRFEIKTILECKRMLICHLYDCE